MVPPDLLPKRPFQSKRVYIIASGAVILASIGILYYIWPDRTNVSLEPLSVSAVEEDAPETANPIKAATGSHLKDTLSPEDNRLPPEGGSETSMSSIKETSAPSSEDMSIAYHAGSGSGDDQTSPEKGAEKIKVVGMSYEISDKKTVLTSGGDASNENVDDNVYDNKDLSSTHASTLGENITAEDKLYRKALQLHQQGRLSEAVAMYREILINTPDSRDTLYNLSSAYIKLDDFSSAYDILYGLLKSNPSDPEVLLNIAVAEIGLGRDEDAIDHLESIHTENDELNFTRYLHLGVAMGRAEKFEEALTYYQKAEGLNRDHPKLLFNIAILNDRLGRYPEALDYYSRLLKNESLLPDEAPELNNRIKILQNYISGTGLAERP